MVIETEFSTPTQARAQRSATMAKRSGMVFLSTACGRALGFALQIVLSNALGVAAFGAYTLGSTVLNFLSAMSQAGLHQATVRFLAIGRAQEQPEIVRGVLRFAGMRVIIVSVVLGAALFLLREPIATHVFHEAAFAPTLMWASLVLPFVCGVTWLGFALRGFRAVQAEALLREIVGPGIFLLLCGLAIIAERMSTPFAWLALLVSTALALLYGLMRLRRCLRAFATQHATLHAFAGTESAPDMNGKQNAAHKQKLELKHLGAEMRRFSLPIWFSRLFTTLMSQGDRLLLGAFSAVTQVGLYHAAYRLAAFQSIAMNSFVPMFSTAIAEAHAREDNATIIYYYRVVVRWAMLVTMPLCLVCLVFGRELLHVFGAEFEAAQAVLYIITVASFIDAGVGPAGQFLQMIGRERVASVLVILTAMLTVGLNLLLIPQYGAVGAALGTGAGLALLNLGRLLALRKYLGVFPYSALTLKLLLVSTGAGLLAHVAAPFGRIAQALVLVLLYIIGMRLFCLHEDDEEMLARAGKRLGVNGKLFSR